VVACNKTLKNVFFFFFFAILGLNPAPLACQTSLYHSIYASRAVVFILFLRWDVHDPPASTSQLAGITDVHHYTQLVIAVLEQMWDFPIRLHTSSLPQV
jgi:hypothetical protein